jgi:hypothetical protein
MGKGEEKRNLEASEKGEPEVHLSLGVSFHLAMPNWFGTSEQPKVKQPTESIPSGCILKANPYCVREK